MNMEDMQDLNNSELEKGLLRRSSLLLGADNMDRLDKAKVILFGIGGVGSWCAESLVRSGLRHLTIVDADCVCITNCNRQLMATVKTIGEPKVEALRSRLLDINPNAEITAIQRLYSQETADEFHLEEYDFVIDAIDSLKDKANLILHATSIPTVTLFSSMGAALRIDPTRVKVAEFWKVRNDPLGAALRKKLKRAKTIPQQKFQCVYSDELPLDNLGTDLEMPDSSNDPRLKEQATLIKKAQTNGSLSHITGIFGFTLAGLVMQKITSFAVSADEEERDSEG